MKPWILILLCFVCALLIYFSVLNFAKDSSETRYLEYKDCKVEYMYSSSDFYFSNYRTTGHSFHNRTELMYAKNELIKCLSEKYLVNKDEDIKSKILEYYNSDKQFTRNYSLLKYYFIPPIDTILKYGHLIFRDDTFLLKQYSQYKMTKDQKVGLMLYEKYKTDSSLVFNDFDVLNNVHNRTDIPSIDSICKYKDEIFGDFNRIPD